MERRNALRLFRDVAFLPLPILALRELQVACLHKRVCTSDGGRGARGSPHEHDYAGVLAVELPRLFLYIFPVCFRCKQLCLNS